MGQRRFYSEVEVKAGLFLAFCLALFVGMIFIFAKVSRFWRGTQEIQVIFTSVAGLHPDAPVRLNGVELGRVKSMRVVYLDHAVMQLLTPLVKRQLDFLPLTEAQRRQLRLVSEEEFDAKCREALLDKTVIQLTLEMLVEGQIRRYRADDVVSIATTMMGESSIEMVSGSGTPLEPGTAITLVGESGDFFGALARSMEGVKEVLSEFTGIVTAEDQKAFKRGTGRLENIFTGLHGIAKVAQDRQEVTVHKVQALEKPGKDSLDALGNLFDKLSKDSQRVFANMEESKKLLNSRFEALSTVASKANEETRAQAKEIMADVKGAVDAGTPYFLDMQTNFSALSQRLEGLSVRSDRMLATAGRVMEQSEPEFERIASGLNNGVKNLSSLKYIMERADQIIGNKDLGEHEYYTALETYRDLRRAVRGPRETLSEIDYLREQARALDSKELSQTLKEMLERIRARLVKFNDSLEPALDKAAEAMVPPFVGQGEGGLVAPFPRKLGPRAVAPVLPK